MCLCYINNFASPHQVAGDMLFHDQKFDLAQVINYFNLHNDNDLAIYYQMEPGESINSRGIVEVCSSTNK